MPKAFSLYCSFKERRNNPFIVTLLMRRCHILTRRNRESRGTPWDSFSIACNVFSYLQPTGKMFFFYLFCLLIYKYSILRYMVNHWLTDRDRTLKDLLLQDILHAFKIRIPKLSLIERFTMYIYFCMYKIKKINFGSYLLSITCIV